jgi:tetratricopeptide (TPR) repeat protein/DNA-binding CsgD family transcriptional regulator
MRFCADILWTTPFAPWTALDIDVFLGVINHDKNAIMKKITSAFTFIYLLALAYHSQSQPQIDSLQNAYEKAGTDTIKVKLLGTLYNYYLYRERKKAKMYALEEMQLSEQLDYPKGLSLGNYHLGVYYNNIGMNDSANIYYAAAMKIARDLNDIAHMSDINHAMAIQQFYKGDLDKAETMILETIEMNKQIADSVGLAISLDFLGMVHQNKGNYSIALKHIHDGLDIFQKVQDSIRLADSYVHLAAIEANLQNRKKSIEYNLIALKIYEHFNDIYYQSQALNDIGQTYLLLEDYENAKSFLERGLKKSMEANSRSISGTIYTNLGKLQIAMKEPEKSLEYFQKALGIQNKLKETRKQIITKNQIGNAYNKMNQPRLAIPILTEVIAISDSIDSKSTLRYAYSYRSESYKLMNNYKMALKDFESYKILGDTLFNREKSRQIEELRTVHDLEQKDLELALQDEEIKVLNSEIKVSNLKKTLYAIGMVSFVIIGGLIYFSLSQRLKKKEIERKKQEEIFRQEIEFKKKELASQTLHLVQKNTFIQELKENLERIKSSPELFKIEFRRIVMLLKRENASDKDWEVFKSYFSEVHESFDHKLMSIYPGITEKELRMASFIKMKLSTKEIAAMLNVLPDSVLKSKYRLKKKLNADKQTDLYQFLHTL